MAKRHIKEFVRARLREPRQGRRYKKPVNVAQGSLVETALKLCSKFSHEFFQVYFVKCGGFVKIGYTQGSVLGRVNSFLVGSPFDYEILATVPGAFKLETSLHKLFKAYWHKREWFRYEGELVDFIHAVKDVVLPRFAGRGEVIREKDLLATIDHVNVLGAIDREG